MAYTIKVRTKNYSARPLRKSISAPCRTIARLGSLTPTSRIFPRGMELGRRIVEINTVEAIENSRDKAKTKLCFEEDDIPQAVYYPFSADTDEIEFPIVVKRRIGFQGRGMQKIDNADDLKQFIDSHNMDDYIIEKFYNYAREYRLHCTQHECFMAWRKLRREDAEVRWFFNSSNCNWVGPDHELFNKPNNWDDIENDCIRAIKSVGLDIGAVDCRVSTDGKYIVLEVNSAPALGEYGIEKYKEQLHKLAHA